jgi:hypothetical protein
MKKCAVKRCEAERLAGLTVCRQHLGTVVRFHPSDEQRAMRERRERKRKRLH